MSETLEINNESLDLKSKIDGAIDNAEQKAKVYEALGMLKIFDSQIPDFDIDMTYDKKNDKFYFVSGNEILNIPMNIDKIGEIGEVLVKLLNNKNKLGITGKQDFRMIFEDSFLGNEAGNQIYYKGTQFRGNTLDLNEAINNNNFAEELYRFTQGVKKIPEKDWIIKGGIGSHNEIGIK
ncbi:MAG: hypothetical protein PHI37_00850 [Candidatus Gracilibacteria bacterium]|nr:hypothetical protein [Candidatus Gracilibacteria bacterium]